MALLLCASLGLAACGDGNIDDAKDSDASYAEGRVRMEIEFLDTGLLKGHSYADAADGWRAASINVDAVDYEGVMWPVIEPDTTGLGSSSAKEFFEVTIQELPRGKQITLTTTVEFEDSGGRKVERTAVDRWPP